jgi:hypothetical protein
MYRSS